MCEIGNIGQNKERQLQILRRKFSAFCWMISGVNHDFKREYLLDSEICLLKIDDKWTKFY